MFFLNYNKSLKNIQKLTEEKKDFFKKIDNIQRIQNLKKIQNTSIDNSLYSLYFNFIKKNEKTNKTNNETRINNEKRKTETKINNEINVNKLNEQNSLQNLVDINISKIGIIYVYYERINEQKNQTNLSFFIKYGLNNNLWSDLDISTLFVINGRQCEVLIPKKPNIYVLKEDNCSDWEGWYNGIKYFEKMKGRKIWEIFDYLCLINSGAIGPIYEENQNDHWLNPFYQKMVKDNAVICSPCMSFLPITHPSGPGPKVVPIFTLIRCTKSIIHLLTNVKISCTDKLSTDTHYMNHFLSLYNSDTNTVFGKKKDKTDAALTGEYGLSRILINNGYRVTSLLYNHFDCHDPNKWKINGFKEPDRYKSFNGKNVPLNTIFIKNIWRSNDTYVSLPVLYNECLDFVYSKLNMKNIFKSTNNILYNYELLNYNSTGVGLHNSPNWNSKKDFYYKYGIAEECVLFNLPFKNYNGCLIYAHYDSENIVKDYVIQTIKTFRYFGYDILFYTASKKMNNINTLPCNVIYVNNQGPGTDWKIWLHGCISLLKNNKKYSHVFLLNDSIILPINGIENFGKTILNMRETSDFWGHWESNEIEWHLVGTPIEFKFSMINDVINFINNSINSIKSSNNNNKLDYVFKVEVKFSKYLVDLGYKWNAVIKNDILDNSLDCPVFNPLNIQKWINNPMSFAIKWKYMISYLNKEIVSPELNYLTRFLYYGKYGIISDGEKNGAFIKSV
jgi:hypothetical protein